MCDKLPETSLLEQVVLRERQARDRSWWPQMAATYWPDSRVHLTWYAGDGPGFVTASERMSHRGDRSVHRLSAPVVHRGGDRAWLELPAAIEVRSDVNDVPVDLVSYTRIGYRLERREDEWRIAALDVVYERDTIAAVLPGTQIDLPHHAFAGYRSSYAVLAWHLHRRGYDVSGDLLGDDQPGPRDEYYANTFAWLHG
ncbi:nuclear transport factor 2 family protein [Cryobacterium sp. TMT4-31]|uniref:nuclear transport factor 2 family protein n=1 Tax=Cryobacterium sp. TMT4-31 TaxID=1259259 RepID=UPI001069E6C4|nr:nuclear transport factor 2 family protein [Cryobacterium sp. TMT4-31]TFC86369.1 nuclear transport factor 2 family protein [Cryobacterium sp. TMT4-31]